MGSRKLSRVACAVATAGIVMFAADAARATQTWIVKAGGGGDWTSIQAAIDAASPGDVIDVYPGSYDETAADSEMFDHGVYTFGLFVGEAKSGITIQGVHADGSVVDDADDAEAFVTTNATNNFGYSGVFVEGDGVTISGLDIGPNAAGDDKTFEVIGDAFALLNCDVSAEGSSLYFGDWRFDEATDTSHIRTYRIQGNIFRDGVSIDIANGAGYSGEVDDRIIRKNSFVTAHYWPAISFNGSDTGVPWFVHSVGGAKIVDNSFVNTFAGDGDPVHMETEAHIRARGTYDNDQFNWSQYWSANRYDHAYIVGPKVPSVLETYEYAGAYGTFHDVRRIGAIKSAEEAHLLAGDKLKSK